MGMPAHEQLIAETRQEVIREQAQVKPTNPEPLGLRAFALNGLTEKLRQEMKEAVFVMDKIAIRGQFVAISGPPNGGKTLFTLKMLIDAVRSGIVDGEDIFYINVDDNQEGAIVKTEIVEKYGIQMIVPSMADREKTGGVKFEFVKMVQADIASGSVDGKILVIDTYKKFTSTMKKDQQSKFNDLLRQFVMSGGTVIVLAHVNKRKEAGQWTWGGTSDLRDDCDTGWIVDFTKSEKGITYDFIFQKGRGLPGENYSFFSPAKTHGTINEDQVERYRRLLDGIEVLSESEAKKEKRLAAETGRRDELWKKCHQAITLIKDFLANGSRTRSEIEKEYKKSDIGFEVSTRDFRNVVEVFSGIIWDVKRVGNKKYFTLKNTEKF